MYAPVRSPYRYGAAGGPIYLFGKLPFRAIIKRKTKKQETITTVVDSIVRSGIYVVTCARVVFIYRERFVFLGEKSHSAEGLFFRQIYFVLNPRRKIGGTAGDVQRKPPASSGTAAAAPGISRYFTGPGGYNSSGPGHG